MTDIAVVQLVSWGDVLISTSLVHAIKQARQCNLTYYTSSACRGAVDNNPDIDNLVVIPATKNEAWALFGSTVDEARRKHQQVFTPWPGFIPREEWCLPAGKSIHNFMYAYARSGIMNGIDVPVPLKLWLHTTQAEEGKMAWFVGTLPRSPSTKMILMEMMGESSQTFCNPEWLRLIVPMLMKRYNNDVHVFVSAGGPHPPAIIDLQGHFRGRVHFMNEYSLREMSALYNYCDIFLGVSSGTSNACHGHRCRTNVRWFETVSDPVWDSSPLRRTGKVFHYGADLHGYMKLLAENLP